MKILGNDLIALNEACDSIEEGANSYLAVDSILVKARLGLSDGKDLNVVLSKAGGDWEIEILDAVADA